MTTTGTSSNAPGLYNSESSEYTPYTCAVMETSPREPTRKIDVHYSIEVETVSTTIVLLSYDTGKASTLEETSNKLGRSIDEEPKTTKSYSETGVLTTWNTDPL